MSAIDSFGFSSTAREAIKRAGQDPTNGRRRVRVRRGTNTIESYKESVEGDGLRIREQLPRLIELGHERMSAAEKDLLKWVGVFFRKPTPGKFMMRVRVPGGLAQSRQLRAIAELSRRLGNCVVDFTTRQQIQLRGFTIASVPEIWEQLRGVDLHSLQTGMDNVRNICGCPLAGVTINELFDASLVIAELDRMLVGSQGNPEFTDLPRKFNVGVTGCLENCTPSESQDLALIPAIRRDRPGFNVLVGGKMGSGGFTLASPLDVFVQPGEAARCCAELVRIFRDHGPREARSKCRFRFLVDDWGLPKLRAELERRLECELPRAGRDVRGTGESDHLGVAWQKQPGFRSVGLSFPQGRTHPGQLDELARLADEYGDGRVRLTTSQNAILPNVPADRVSELLDEPLLQELSPMPSPFRRRLVACTGTDYCNLAQIDTKGYAAQLARELEKRLGTRRAPISMNWSGCPAGCGNHEAAEIGFRGMRTRINDEVVDAVAIYVGGRCGPEARPAAQVIDVVRCDANLAGVVSALVRQLDRAGHGAGFDVPLEQLRDGASYAAGESGAEPPGPEQSKIADQGATTN
jgi:ferredoxin-nitrite reductase